MNFKKIITLVATVCLLAIVLAIPALAVVTESNGDGYVLYNGEKVLASEVPEGAEIIFLDGMRVIEWDGNAEGLELVDPDMSRYKVADYLEKPSSAVAVLEINGNRSIGQTISDYSDSDGWSVTVQFLDPVASFVEDGLTFVGFSETYYTPLFAYKPFEDEPEGQPSLFENITTLVNSAISWVGSFASSIVSNPIILIFCVCSFIGLGIGLFSRLKR